MAFSFLSSISSFLVWLTVKNANLKSTRARVSSYGQNKLAILASSLLRAEESPISDASSASWLRRFSASLCLSLRAFSRSLSSGKHLTDLNATLDLSDRLRHPKEQLKRCRCRLRVNFHRVRTERRVLSDHVPSKCVSICQTRYPR